MRLDKYLAGAGGLSRSESKELIRKGQVRVNGEVVTKPEFQVPTDAHVTLGGKECSYQQFHYYMLNKPPGVVSSTSDPRDITVLSLLPPPLRKGISPVGRLDKDTVGLLLMTDDGELGHRLLSPRSHVKKVYLAGLARAVTKEDTESFLRGIALKDGALCKPARVEALGKEQAISMGADPDQPVMAVPAGDTDAEKDAEKDVDTDTDTGKAAFCIKSYALVTITEGKYHQIKRMFAARGNKVVYLKRLSMGGLNLDPSLKEGQYRPLTAKELECLKKEAFCEGPLDSDFS